MLLKSILGWTALVASAVAADLPEIEIIGNKFFFKNNGTQFLMRGIAYQQNPTNTTASFHDPLADTEACKRDIPYMQAVNTNIIRVYALNASLDHTECMNLLTDAGIYVIADLSQPDQSINRDSPEWNLDLYKRYTDVVDKFLNYSNILGFFAGNEVTNNVTNTDASAFVKAAVRDTKAYIKAKGYRQIPVGYSANDDTDIRDSLADYFACGDEDERADFFGINMYEWCGSSTYTSSGYSDISKQYQNLGIPIFFSEYGCNRVTPRQFQEVGTLYGSDMTNEWSGGIVYMYFQEDNNYGLVSIKGNSVSTLADYNNYKSQIQKISPSLAAASAASTVSATSCPTSTSNWLASTNLPPTPDQDVCDCATSGAQCVVSDDVDSEDYGDLIGVVCGIFDCSGISTNATAGKYGAFSPCDSKNKLNFVLNAYYEANSQHSDACDFSGSATRTSANASGSCSALLKSAGASGTGVVSGNRSGSGNSRASSGSGSGSSRSGSSASRSGSLRSGSASSSNAAVSVKGVKPFSMDSVAKTILIGGGFAIGITLTFL
ncbi:carbohydrate-binding module family 43 protein [Suhomyces tanzawaensis NRRL Y-17324]|uniref:1,3-beta-glucanosyltransferase n=1 Tax=Suhomyces tanzawaensis NRRL Y-17324 TaxID=984487 RepID=A0A1E4SBG6_9ASCO|nr:carbohydrate-binding module family 43 protein [Suhomyces tanzawaensis NRRL Y-17324]ODV76841.1 carbohydrate-binding module family 43 protein [Suhomyces tanzawaensis NRRL Y-17324]